MCDDQSYVNVHMENENIRTKCVQHTEQHLTRFCNSCKVLACELCWTEQHIKHEQADVMEVAEELRIQLAQRIEYIKNMIIPAKTRASQEIHMNREEYLKHGAYLRLEITERTKLLKSQLDLTCEGILHELQDREDFDIKSLDSSAFATKEELKHISSLLFECDLAMQEENVKLFVKSAQGLISKLSSVKIQNPFKPVRPPTFVTSDSINRNAIEKLYGYLQQDSSSALMETKKTLENRDLHNHVRVIIGHVATLSLTNNDAAYCIRTLPNGHAWVGTGAQSVRLVNLKGDVLNEVFLDFYPYNLAILGNALLLSNGQTIKSIQDGKMTEFYHAAPFYAQGISRTRKNEILACLAKRNEGQILRLDASGKILQSIQFDANGHHLYRSPTKVSESPLNGDICVADSAENSVIVVDKEGNLRFTYRGLKGDTFSPFYVTHDSFGNILIGDNSHFRIHLVNKDGVFLQYLLTVEDGLYSPWGLDVDENQNLWVGTLSSKIWIVEYIGQ